MANKRSKRYQKAAALVEEGKSYSLVDAAALIKQFPAPKFDQTVTLSFKLGVDPRKSDQMVRGTCPLPNGSGKNVVVAVFATGEAAEAAKAAGAEHVGFEDLIEKVKGGFTDFDVAIATTDAMAEVRKIARVLGPRGLMPNPKTGTVTDDTAKAIGEVKAGRVDFKLDKNGNVSATVGRASFEPEKLAENASSLIDAVLRAKPASAKGVYVQAVTMAATMSPGVEIEPAAFVR
ncbi:50S ribosomal protein L1 [Sulfuriroseicoccus oceanibius]|uniref:Large ribosomal subunit protein uL1 n=1 Tax=Sulfuriroseicoccus oceanibius TaxID=2707525 RepID=A0A6B3L756_9BACT|nr:50S ribosomal protein L1 [Sulfuriroseicoccus oceanibius]QQL45764.1 50S ribosomal protein L1 [Sulfuriroseicoccus oceanibius]